MKYFANKKFFGLLKNFVVKNKTFLILVLIFFAGAYFRFYNLSWDKNYPSHPDEIKNIAFPSVSISLKDPNPHMFVYGNFTIYFYRLISEAISLKTGDRSWISDWGKINLIGRNVSAITSSLSIILIFLLAQKAFNDKKVAILASFFGAFTVLLIQLSHFATTESLLIFWLLLIYLLSFKILDKQSMGSYHLLGVVSGLALATKTTAFSFLIIPFAVYFFISFQESVNFFIKFFHKKINLGSRRIANYFKILIKIFNEIIQTGDFGFWKKQGYFFVFLILTLIFFFLASPFSFLDYYNFKQSMDYEMAVATGKTPVFYTYQFFNTKPYLFYIDNLIWAQGPFLKIFSVFGIVYLLLLAIFKRKIKYLLLIIWPLAYFYIIGGWHTKFIRYLALILPFLAIFAAKFLIDLRSKSRITGNILIFIGIFFTFAYSSAFLSIYKNENTRGVASRWMYQNIPSGAKILTEQYEYPGLPVYLPNEKTTSFNVEALSIYDPDNEQKIKYYAAKLASGDYLVLASRRLYGTLINLPEKYPLTSQYYKLLFEGKLGYTLVADFDSYPEIFGLKIVDDRAEETFQVFDHPKVLIYKNTEKFQASDYEKLLTE